MRRMFPLILFACGALSCNSFSPAIFFPLDINGRWQVDSELGTVRATCITIENNTIVRVGECDESPGTTTFAYNPAATISEHDEVVIGYSVQDPTMGPRVLFDMHRHADGILRGTMILYTNAVATSNSTITNVFWTKK